MTDLYQTASGSRLHEFPRRYPRIGGFQRPDCWWPGADRERGAGTLLSAFVLMVIGMAALTGLWCAGWIESAHQARSAADLAALAGARAEVEGQNACRAASEAATANGAQTVNCSVDGSAQQFVVHVVCVVDLRPRVPIQGAPRRVTATAASGNVEASR